jgi:ABC-type nitrate/sulfonate/bicarbonate transport system substrate-binding protein
MPEPHYLITDNDDFAEEVITKVAEVLARSHRAAEEANQPDAARAVLGVAQSFADELAAARPDFNRERFLGEIMELEASQPKES